MWLFRKPTTEELKNKAYIIYTEFGPKLKIPWDKRLADKFPQVDKWTINLWISEFKEISKEIDKFLFEKNSFNNEEFRKQISAKHPFMNKKSLDRAGFLGSYMAWHEGYDRNWIDKS